MNPLSWIKNVLQNKTRSTEAERKAIIDSALDLERRHLTKQISPVEYEQEHKKIRLKLNALDLYKSAQEAFENIDRIADSKSDLLEHDSAKAKVILHKSFAAAQAMGENKKKFESGKIALEQYVELLKQANSQALDFEHSLKIIVRKLESRKIEEISELLKKELGKSRKKEKEEMFDQVYLEAKSKHRNTGYIQRYREPAKKQEQK